MTGLYPEREGGGGGGRGEGKGGRGGEERGGGGGGGGGGGEGWGGGGGGGGGGGRGERGEGGGGGGGGREKKQILRQENRIEFVRQQYEHTCISFSLTPQNYKSCHSRQLSHTSDIRHVVMHSVCSKLSVYNMTQETALYWDDTRTEWTPFQSCQCSIWQYSTNEIHTISMSTTVFDCMYSSGNVCLYMYTMLYSLFIDYRFVDSQFVYTLN